MDRQSYRINFYFYQCIGNIRSYLSTSNHPRSTRSTLWHCPSSPLLSFHSPFNLPIVNRKLKAITRKSHYIAWMISIAVYKMNSVCLFYAKCFKCTRRLLFCHCWCVLKIITNTQSTIAFKTCMISFGFRKVTGAKTTYAWNSHLCFFEAHLFLSNCLSCGLVEPNM